MGRAFAGPAAVISALALMSPALALEPSFDCTKAESDAEKAVCSDDTLASMDLELSRLFQRAAEGPNMDPDRHRMLQAEQRGWIKGRDECWKSDLGIPFCTASEYAFRIAEIRQGYADARAENGASLGPYAYVCEGMEVPVSAVFVNTLAPMVVLRWGENAIVLPSVATGSGAKYASDLWYGGEALFWTSRDEATFMPPGQPETTCLQDDIG